MMKSGLNFLFVFFVDIVGVRRTGLSRKDNTVVELEEILDMFVMGLRNQIFLVFIEVLLVFDAGYGPS